MAETNNKETTRRFSGGIARIAPGLNTLLHYDRSWLRRDLVAGVSIAAVALPIGVAHAEIVNVPTEIGIYSAIFPLFAYALFGSSRHLMVGPDSATSILVAAALLPLAGGDPQRYLALMVLLSLMTGVLLLIGGFLRLGFVASFLSQPILNGFLSGTALVLILGQMKPLLGYSGTAIGFFPRLIELFQSMDKFHLPTLFLGLSMLAVLVAVRRLLPQLPSALLVTILGILLVFGLGLDQKGISVLGTVPAGMPKLTLVLPTFLDFREILTDATAIALLSFISGILTVKSFARRSGSAFDSDQELIGFGASNIVSGLAQGFPVAGGSTRTAVALAMGGMSQLAGIAAAATMLLVLFFLTEPLAYVPEAALAAVIIVSGWSLLDMAAFRELYTAKRLELGFSLVAMLGVLILGVLPGVATAVGLSLVWLVYVESVPPDAVLGRVPGLRGYYNVKQTREAKTVPGVLIYQFRANIVFYNAERFKARVLEAVAASDTPVEWVVVDASPINYVDFSAVKTIDELREELLSRGTKLVVAHEGPDLLRYFESDWVQTREKRLAGHYFPTIKAALNAFAESNRKK